MLLVGSKKDGYVTIHAVIGPETEFYMDLNGAMAADLSPILAGIKGTDKVVLSITRCKNEETTAKIMLATDIPFLGTEQEEAKGSGDPVVDQIEAALSSLEKAQKAAPKQNKAASKEPPKTIGRCSYCGKPDVELMPIFGFKICAACVQIELGRNKQVDVKNTEVQP
jgi:hypothetical protein